MNNKLIILAVVFMFVTLTGLLPGVLAEIELTIPFNQEFDLKRPCFNNETFCSAAAVCNVTIIYPDGSILTNNQQMTNQNSFHNVTLTNFNISQLGIMPTIVVCDDPGGAVNASGKDTFEIEVTGDGFKPNVFPIEFSIFILGFILIATGKFKEDLGFFVTFGGMILMVIGVVTLYPGYSGLNYSTLQGQVVGIGGAGVGFYFMIERFFSRDKQVDHFDQEDDGRFHDND